MFVIYIQNNGWKNQTSIAKEGRRTQIQYKASVDIGTIHNLGFEGFKAVSVYFVYSVFATI